MVMKTVHLICGLPCAGKTTFAKQLVAERRALYLGLDEALIALHGSYSLAEVGSEEHVRRVIACRRSLWNIAEHALQIDQEVILDDGFFFRQTRERYATLCAGAGAQSVLYFLDAPYDLLLARLQERNRHLPHTNFEIAAVQLEQFLRIFEPPTAAEGNELRVVHTERDDNAMAAAGTA